MKTRDPLAGLRKIWDEVDELERRASQTRKRGDKEIKRLAKNKHRQEALRRCYWDGIDYVSVYLLGELFRIETNKVSLEAGPLTVETTCLLCFEKVWATVLTRSALIELNTETATKNPKHRICGNCVAFRQMDLELLRKKPGEQLTPQHRAAYERYLQTPQWKERRDRTVKRAKGKCSLCSSKKQLNVHHRIYTRIGEERPEDLICICRSCHSGHHGH